MIWFISVLVIVIAGVISFCFTKSLKISCYTLVVSGIIVSVISTISVNIDIKSKTTAIETWSGTVTEVYHKEEWDEWHPPWDEVVTTTDSDGNESTYTVHHPGYWEHHNAINKIKTSDGGEFSITNLPDGKVANDNYINTNEELAAYYPVESPSASIHFFENKVQTSYSVFKTNDVDENLYQGLPDYITTTQNYIDVDRFIGFNSSGEANKLLSEKNSWLNKSIPDPEKEGKMRSWKQVNLVFVNLGTNKTSDWGYALENKWQRGAKNDFIVSLSTDESGKVLWCYPISWSESELCKIEVRNLVTSKTLSDEESYKQMVTEVSDIIADKFVRKEFADFSYIKVNVSTKTIMFDLVAYIIMLLLWCGFLAFSDTAYYWKRNRYR